MIVKAQPVVPATEQSLVPNLFVFDPRKKTNYVRDLDTAIFTIPFIVNYVFSNAMIRSQTFSNAIFFLVFLF